MIFWGDDCAWYGGVCTTRAKLKRAVHEAHEALDGAGSQAAHRVAERAYHTALYALANHSCEASPVGDEDERSREARSATQGNLRAVASDTPTGIDEIERLIDQVCELHRRYHTSHMADVGAEYRDARLVLRTRVLMLMANQVRPFHERLEEAERATR